MCGKERNNIPLLRSVAGSRHSAEPVKEDYMIANDDMRRSMHTDLRDGGQLEIEAIQVKKSGLAGTDDQVVYLSQIKREWPDLPHQEVGTFVYVRMEYRIENATIVKAGQTLPFMCPRRTTCLMENQTLCRNRQWRTDTPSCVRHNTIKVNTTRCLHSNLSNQIKYFMIPATVFCLYIQYDI